MDALGFDVVTKHSVSAYAFRHFSSDVWLQAVLQRPAPVGFARDRTVTAAAVLLLGASLALDEDNERELRQYMRLSLGRVGWDAASARLRILVNWLA